MRRNLEPFPYTCKENLKKPELTLTYKNSTRKRRYADTCKEQTLH
ncbi:hypothetical protein HMPREF0198_0513 [Cardiobacterium hominis ATCC 15826]|uniref:Uncharacterized protein n=1 Tax=Cardiobacterium hominis (strain ATCC 15826 / DSM 8339 / NCTC 10426 / 6573) TaxID=638300 RepID=C8N7N6_CARH6|nr:hypothetical protein HMPREF0198_0513 [Cardiobacterium hominis ATCC 15826]